MGKHTRALYYNGYYHKDIYMNGNFYRGIYRKDKYYWYKEYFTGNYFIEFSASGTLPFMGNKRSTYILDQTGRYRESINNCFGSGSPRSHYNNIPCNGTYIQTPYRVSSEVTESYISKDGVNYKKVNPEKFKSLEWADLSMSGVFIWLSEDGMEILDTDDGDEEFNSKYHPYSKNDNAKYYSKGIADISVMYDHNSVENMVYFRVFEKNGEYKDYEFYTEDIESIRHVLCIGEEIYIQAVIKKLHDVIIKISKDFSDYSVIKTFGTWNALYSVIKISPQTITLVCDGYDRENARIVKISENKVVVSELPVSKARMSRTVEIPETEEKLSIVFGGVSYPERLKIGFLELFDNSCLNFYFENQQLKFESDRMSFGYVYSYTQNGESYLYDITFPTESFYDGTGIIRKI